MIEQPPASPDDLIVIPRAVLSLVELNLACEVIRLGPTEDRLTRLVGWGRGQARRDVLASRNRLADMRDLLGSYLKGGPR